MSRFITCVALAGCLAASAEEAASAPPGLPKAWQAMRYEFHWEQRYTLKKPKGGEPAIVYPNRIHARLAWTLKEATKDGATLEWSIESIKVEKGGDGPELKVFEDEETAKLCRAFEVKVGPDGAMLKIPDTGSRHYDKIVRHLMVGQAWLHLGVPAPGGVKVHVPLLHDLDGQGSRFKDAWVCLLPVELKARAPKDNSVTYEGAFATQPGKGLDLDKPNSEFFVPQAQVQSRVEAVQDVRAGRWKGVKIATSASAEMAADGEKMGVVLESNLEIKLLE